MSKELKSGPGVPMKERPAILEAMNKVAASHNVDPAAIAGIINTESVWKSDAVTGSFVGLTQVGPEFLRKLGLTKRQFLALAAAKQIDAYGTWLDFYEFVKKMNNHGIDCLGLPLARQAAALQAMQFAPNGDKWKAALARGDLTVRSTTSRQAEFLGDTSIGEMETYYESFFKKRPPVYV